MRRKVFNRVLLAAGLLALAGSALFLGIYWRHMPDAIPTHFNAAGQIDTWGSRSTVLLLPIVGAVAFGMFQFVVVLCVGTKSKEARVLETMCRLLSVLTALVFAYITVCSALCVPLGRWFLGAFIAAAAAVMLPCIILACLPGRR